MDEIIPIFNRAVKFAKEHRIFMLFLAAFAVHAIAVLIMYAANLQSFFSGGDDVIYNKTAIVISQQFLKGNFLLKGITVASTTSFFGIYFPALFPILIAIIYTIFPANMITGALFNALLCAIISVVVYLIVVELGGSSNKAFITGFITALYPSLILNSALLLKDSLVILLCIASLLLTIKLIKKFSIWQFILLYLFLIPIINIRFYLGYAIMISFIICWFSFCKSIEFKKRIFYIIAIFIVFGFLPQISYGQGYWGAESFREYLNLKQITFYREIAYAPITAPVSFLNKQTSCLGSGTAKPVLATAKPAPCLPKSNSVESSPTGSSSDLNIKINFKNPWSFIISYPKSFISVLLGPFPWQTKSLREVLALLETIPWYFLLYFIFKGIKAETKNKNTLIFPLIAFSLIFLIVIALFDINYGNFMRVRMAAFISLLCLFPFSLNSNNNFLKKYL